MNLRLLLYFCFSLASAAACAQTTLTIQADKPGAPIQPTMWGVFFEDINFGADGGLYPELIKNRSFEFDMPMMGWKEERTDRFSNNLTSGSAMIIHVKTKEVDPRYAHITINDEKAYSLVNEGFFGMGVKQGLDYSFSIWLRPLKGTVAIRADLIDDKGEVIGSTIVSPIAKGWMKYESAIKPGRSFPKARLRLSFTAPGTIDIDKVSLFPPDTWKNRLGGLRADLVQLLADLKPGFLRFPGGCIVEGRDLAKRYQWKKTVGPIDQRELLINRWNNEFRHRPAPDYFQTFGLGFFEYFQLAEDIGASPLPILSCGMACQFNTAELVPMEELDPYIQDALDLIEFANGPSSTKWGKLRADMGHPEPFNMKMIGVGNEQWGMQYIERYIAFANAIKAKYPDIKIVSGAGPFPDGEMFEYGWAELRKLNAELVDEHYYKGPKWFFENSTRYDSYDRNGPKIFAGEYAAQSVQTGSPDNKNTWECALSEAAFMTGLERNADLVHLASYAPLFGNAEGWQWTPDLIWFNNLNSYGTTSYHVQKLFSTNRGTHLLPILNGNEKVTGQNGLYATAAIDQASAEVIVKLVNNTAANASVDVLLKGKSGSEAKIWTLKGGLQDVNTFENPALVSPVEGKGALKKNVLKLALAPYSLTVARIKR